MKKRQKRWLDEIKDFSKADYSNTKLKGEFEYGKNNLWMCRKMRREKTLTADYWILNTSKSIPGECPAQIGKFAFRFL